MALDTELAVKHETGRNVAIKGTGDRVKITFACGRAVRIRSRMRTRFAWFSSQEDTRNPCLSGSNRGPGTARQKASPLRLSYQISDNPRVMTKMSVVPMKIGRASCR